MKDIVLKGKGVTKTFLQGGRSVPVLREIDVEIYQGDFTIIMGPSGAGKSTLLYALSGMDTISEGRIFYKETEISGFGEKQMADLRAAEFGFVFQQTHLVSNMTLFENIVVAGYLDRSRTEKDVHARAGLLLEKMQIREARDRLPGQTSGGEAQRAAIARAIINKPGLLFADEPTGSLNRSNSDGVFDLLTGLHQSSQSIVMVTHDLRAAVRGTRILYLEDGKILDEMVLPAYETAQEKSRMEQVSRWLSGLSW